MRVLHGQHDVDALPSKNHEDTSLVCSPDFTCAVGRHHEESIESKKVEEYLCDKIFSLEDIYQVLLVSTSIDVHKA